MPAPSPLTPELKETLKDVANTVRGLTMDAVQKANSGHPGMPMGCAELGAYMYGVLMRYNPKDPHWLDRDRVILSAGHGSMWLYALMHLSGYSLTLDDIRNFRQLHSKTPGHPESHITEGVETTTGPLGQGVGNAVGQALGLKLIAAKFSGTDAPAIDSKVYCIAGDGCMMEGVSSEVSAFAGHVGLDNLVLIYDANNVTLDGPLADAGSEDTRMRYESYGWDVFTINGNDFDELHKVFSQIKQKQTKPTLVIAHTVIGMGSPNKAGTYKVHGSPLGEEEVTATKKALGIPEEKFYIPESVKKFFAQKLPQDVAIEKQWSTQFANWQKSHAAQATEFDHMKTNFLPADLEQQLWNLPVTSPIASRSASQVILDLLGEKLPQLYGGSADLSHSDMTMMKKYPLVAKNSFTGRNIKYGIREFGMATIATGLSQTGMIRPYIGTFLTFSDYMRNAIRLAALQGANVVYQFTHDSIFLGEDGPTHQPVEHLMALRAIPHLNVIRPADVNETKMAWIAALQHTGPTALILSRQNLPDLGVTKVPFKDGLARGAYIIRKEKSKADFTLIATGSEVALALDVANALEKQGKQVRVVSMPCWELFEQQGNDYKKTVLGGDIGKRVSIEAGIDQGWYKYIGLDGVAIAINGFGASAPAGALAKEFGFNVDAILQRIM